MALSFGCVCSVGALLSFCQACDAQVTDDPAALTAGTILVRARGVGVFPIDKNTTITPIGGYVQISDTGSPELDLTYFFTDHVAVEGETGFTRDTLTARDTVLGTIPVGTVWTAPVIAVLQYHLSPHGRWNPYLGAGISILPTFGDSPAGGAVQQLSVASQVGAAFQAGIDVHITGPWYGNVDLKKLMLETSASVNDGMINANGHINPWIVGLGIGYRF